MYFSQVEIREKTERVKSDQLSGKKSQKFTRSAPQSGAIELEHG